MFVFRRTLVLHLAALFVALAVPVVGWSPTPRDADYLDAAAHIFLRDEVTHVDLTIAPADFQSLLDNPWSDDQKTATVRWRNSVIDTTLADVAVSVRGNLSRGAHRKSFKLDLNDLVPGRAFHGLEAINLNAEPNDPTLLRRMLAHEFLLRMNLPVSRIHYVALHVNGAFFGMRVHVEHNDEEFTDSWFGNKNGNLYKCLHKSRPADLRFLPEENYLEIGDGEIYSERNNRPDTDPSDLAALIRLIDTQPSSVIREQLDAHIHVDNLLRYFAANVAIGSWDDYWYGSNNYYLYNNAGTGRFELIPYDYDNTFGVDFFNTDWSTRHFDNWGDGGFGSTPAPLVDALFDHSAWRRHYRRYLIRAIDILEDPGFRALPAQWHALLAPWFDGTIESGGINGTADQGAQHHPYFLNYNQPTNWTGGAFHTLGILPFIDRRAASLRQQLDSFAGSTEPLPAVRINEVMASNATTLADNAGEFDDWIELYNNENFPVDISGWHLSDKPTDPGLFRFPAGTVIPAKGFLLVWADNQPEQSAPGHLHAPFALDRSGETLILSTDDARGRVFVDGLDWPFLLTDRSFGRYPDGSDNVMEFAVPTPLAPNDNSTPGGGTDPRTPPRLFINEFMADNATTVADNAGQFDDWIEIYNDEEEPVDLSGMFLTDNLLNPTKWRFPIGTTIAAKGFLLVWADNDNAQNAPGHLHASFALSKGGEAIGLFDTEENALQLVHSVTFGEQQTDVSMGLLPDGAEPFVFLSHPTPGLSNATPPVLPGDVDGDGVITPADAQAAFLCYLLADCPSGRPALAADFCPPGGDGIITPLDAQGIFNAFLGVTPPCP
jgi:hypothetical protein